MARRLIISAYPDFGFFSFARCASTLAFQMLGVAVGWQIYGLTHSTFALGMVGLAQFLPMVLCTLPAGHVADHRDRRVISGLMVGAQGLAIAFLAFGSHGGWLRAPILFAAVAAIGAARAFERPATQSLIPALVSPADLSEAVAWSSGIFEFSSIIGPAVGGLLCGWNPSICYATAAALAFAGAGFLSLISPGRGARSRPPATRASLFSGIHFIRRQPVILGSISLDLFAVLLGGATALLPVYARDILGVGASGFGALRAAPALGSLAMTTLLVLRPIRRRAGRKMFAAVFAFGVATVVFGLSRSFPLSFAALVALGAADIVSVVIRGSLVQLQTPDDMRGRVNAVNGLFIGTSNQLGEFESGVTAAWWGTVPATVLGGVGTLIVGLLWMRAFPELAACDRLDTGPADPEPSSP
jgi:MFS family permease